MNKRKHRFVLGKGKDAAELSDLVLTELGSLCDSFLVADRMSVFSDSSDALTVREFIREVRSLTERFPFTDFSVGADLLAVRTLPESAEAAFYCFCAHFLDFPVKPMGRGDFPNPDAWEAFNNGIDTLLDKRLVVSVAVNISDESRARKDNYILAPWVCGILFHGRENLVSASAAAEFGTIIPWNAIREKDLLFPDSLKGTLGLIARAISRERFDEVRNGLAERGLRSGIAILLYGPPGTGKTEYVRQLARGEKRSIFQIDGGKLDASYFGEKPRNLRNMFLFMRYMSAIMACEPIVFIDEADGLLGRRVEVQRSGDKEENLSANIILEEMNSFTGILFAATNNLLNLDPAVSRRFVLRAEFPVPDATVRAQIWKARLPFLTEEEARTLAERFTLSGGLIDNVASLCLLEEIVYGKPPTIDRVICNCEGQMSGTGQSSRKIGF